MKKNIILLITILLIWMAAYFIINQFVENRNYIDYSLPIDSVIPLIPFFIIIYVSAYILMFLFPLKFEHKKAYIYSLFTLTSITAIIFIIFPGYFPRPELGSDIFSRILAWAYSLDKPYNLFPSSHISLSVLNALIINNKWIYFWVVLIILSTFFTKQHYILDALGGIAVALTAFFVYKKFSK